MTVRRKRELCTHGKTKWVEFIFQNGSVEVAKPADETEWKIISITNLWNELGHGWEHYQIWFKRLKDVRDYLFIQMI